MTEFFSATHATLFPLKPPPNQIYIGPIGANVQPQGCVAVFCCGFGGVLGGCFFVLLLIDARVSPPQPPSLLPFSQRERSTSPHQCGSRWQCGAAAR